MVTMPALPFRSFVNPDLLLVQAAPAVSGFLRRWNLSVYFSLRFQVPPLKSSCLLFLLSPVADKHPCG